jgi:hypothetical protein
LNEIKLWYYRAHLYGNIYIHIHMGISGNEVADGLARQAVESGTVHGQKMEANGHRILARQAMVKQWQHVWRTGDTGRFAHSIRPVVSAKPWFDEQVEKGDLCYNNIKSYV